MRIGLFNFVESSLAQRSAVLPAPQASTSRQHFTIPTPCLCRLQVSQRGAPTADSRAASRWPVAARRRLAWLCFSRCSGTQFEPPELCQALFSPRAPPSPPPSPPRRMLPTAPPSDLCEPFHLAAAAASTHRPRQLTAAQIAVANAHPPLTAVSLATLLYPLHNPAAVTTTHFRALSAAT